ncbi:L-threonylcarbamoyladenylate synthase [Limnohabitans sp. 63ED37-2]|uniref:L-threonylcarbamoyladenylate synthase n=1 Tax=Limnohabitans sp. 63ED37-2 TaxID=1678128 RepID=UPI0007057F8F|nr:L-threonylcarbamoyladenylate synthase [Limnohabitans sp. 63ED37-2]ALK87397.1 Threonylcarbamoyl-AMP synthase [Limnohabitans sp. 63ED37-2]
MILSANEAAIAQAAQALRDGQLVGLPTETVYGLAANATDDAAVAKIFVAKGRPADHPLIVHVASAAQVPVFAAQVPDFAQSLIDAFWPGPLTLILPRQSGVAAASAGGQDSIGLRCPSHPVAQRLLQACAVLGVLGVSAPSANRFGRVSPTSALHVQSELGPDLLILDGGDCDVGIESTIIDCTRGEPVLLRPGHITRVQIEVACGRAVLDKDAPQAVLGQPAPRASGTLESHYAPRAKVRLMSATDIASKLQALGPHANNLGLWSAERPASEQGMGSGVGAGVLWRQQATTAEQAAHDLFGVLRDLDARGVSQIWVQLPPDTPEWEGVRDRLQRAAA